MTKSRSPHGERGLKSDGVLLMVTVFMSLPAWGAWIEIDGLRYYRAAFKSLPAWGAWIEIRVMMVNINEDGKSLPAWGAWIEIF